MGLVFWSNYKNWSEETLPDFVCQEYTAQKVKFSIKNFFSKFDQIRSFLRKILNGKLHFFDPCDSKG